MRLFYKRKQQKQIVQVKPGNDVSNDDVSNDDVSNDDVSNDDVSNDDVSNDDVSIHFLVISMDKSKDRLDILLPQLNNINCSYTIVKGIDGNNMENDIDAIKILSPTENVENKLLGKIFHHIETKNRWIYDGTVSTSFPNLNLNGHYGTKGLTLSNIKAFMVASELNYEWFCVLEDDSEIDMNIYNIIKKTSIINKNKDIILLDKREGGWGGTCAMLYNKRIIKTLISNLNPMSVFSRNSHKIGDTSHNLWDWKLWKYVKYINKNFTICPCVPSGNFESTIG